MTKTKICALTGMSLLVTLGMTTIGCSDEPIVSEPVGEAQIELQDPDPVSGGTLLVMNEIERAVVADTDLDQLVVVDLSDMSVAHTLKLDADDEPGRVIAGPDGTAFVALRRGGAVVGVDVMSGETVRRPVCAAPRGMAYNESESLLHVACAGGELVTLDSDLQSEPTSISKIADDLRDVVISGDRLLVSRFRAAEVFAVSSQGTVLNSDHTRKLNSGSREFSGSVGWMMVPVAGGEVMLLHQRGLVGEIPTGPVTQGSPPYYGGDCLTGIIHAAVSFFDPNGVNVSSPNTGGIGTLVMPVAAALSPQGDRVAVVGAGNDAVFTTPLVRTRNSDFMSNGCVPGPQDTLVNVPGEPVAVAYATSSTLYVQTRQPAKLRLIEADTGEELDAVDMPGPGRRHWGHALFHKAASDTATLSCASCHPEGRDDGRVWRFAGIGQRRTQTMSGGVMETLPLHWDGDMVTLHELMGEVFVNRMGGAEQPDDRIEAMGEWMNGVAAVPNGPAWDPDAVARGSELFHSGEVGCANCHNGEMYTNNGNANVGTGKAFQVPMLVGIAHRAPFMHDGCAETLHDRFQPNCGGGDAHGVTSHLTPAQIDDLVAYLETL